MVISAILASKFAWSRGPYGTLVLAPLPSNILLNYVHNENASDNLIEKYKGDIDKIFEEKE